MRVLILNGAPRSGKDTFIKYATAVYPGRVISCSAIERIKKIARTGFQWGGVKNPEGRRLLSDLEAAATRYNDLPFKLITGRAVVHGLYIIVARRPVLIGRLQTYYNERDVWCRTVLMSRESAEKAAETLSNPADLGYAAYDYDYTINNNGDLNALFLEVSKFLGGLNLPPATVPPPVLDQRV